MQICKTARDIHVGENRGTLDGKLKIASGSQLGIYWNLSKYSHKQASHDINIKILLPQNTRGDCFYRYQLVIFFRLHPRGLKKLFTRRFGFVPLFNCLSSHVNFLFQIKGTTQTHAT